MLGFFKLGKGDNQEGQKLLEYAVVLDHDDVASWQLLAALYQRQNKREAMIGALKELVRIKPHIKYYKEARDAALASDRIDAVNMQLGRMEVFF